MADYSLYNTRTNPNNLSERDRVVDMAMADLRHKLHEHPNLRDVKVGKLQEKRCQKLVVVSKDRMGNSLKDTKQIFALPYETFGAGEYVSFQNQEWLINQADIDDELYINGQMTLCPNTLHFQDSTGKIHSYPYFIESTSPSTDENKMLTTTSSTRKMKLPFDELTSEFFIDKRFMGDKLFGGKPQCFKVIDLDADSERGLLTVVLERDEKINDTDNVELRICDYFSPIPTTPTGTVEITYSGSAEIRAGGSAKTFTAIFKDESGELLDDIVAEWQAEPLLAFTDNISIIIDGNSIKIKADDVEAIVGTAVVLRILNEGFESELNILVKGLV